MALGTSKLLLWSFVLSNKDSKGKTLKKMTITLYELSYL